MSRPPLSRPRVLVADDHAVVAEGITLALATHFTVVGAVRTLADLIPAVLARRPDVIVLDLSFPEGSSLPFLRRVMAHPSIEARVVVLTAHDSGALARAAIDAGADAFLTKTSDAGALRLAVRAAAERPAARRPPPRFVGVSPARRHARYRIAGALLSGRHLEILALMLRGVPRKRIAGLLGLTLKGVDYNIQAIKTATGMPDLLLLVHWMHEHRERVARALEEPGTSDAA